MRSLTQYISTLAWGKNFHEKSKKALKEKASRPTKMGAKSTFLVTASFQTSSVYKGGAVKNYMASLKTAASCFTFRNGTDSLGRFSYATFI